MQFFIPALVAFAATCLLSRVAVIWFWRCSDSTQVDDKPGLSVEFVAFFSSLSEETASTLLASLPAPPTKGISPWIIVCWRVFQFFSHPSVIVLVILLLVRSVKADDGTDMLTWLNGWNGDILTAASFFSQAARTAVANAIGMTPRKNWDYLLSLTAKTTSGTSNRAILFAFVLCHYTANVAKWERAIAAFEAVPVTNQAVPQAIATEVRALVNNVLVWKVSANHPSDRFLSQRLLTCNPTLAAFAFILSRPAAERTRANFIKMRYAPALAFDNSMSAELLAAAKDVAANIVKKPFKQEFYDTIAKSSYPLPSKPTSASGRLNTGLYGTPPYNGASLDAWLAA